MVERSCALFDIDNTIYQGYLIFDLAQAQVEAKLLPERSLDQLHKDTELYSSGQIAYETYAEQAMTHWAQGLVGNPDTYKRVMTHTQEYLRNNREKFFNFFEVLTRRLADTHDLYLVTAEPGFVCQVIRSMFPITGFAASKFSVSRGSFTGMARVLATSQDKAMAINLILASHNVDNSIAFGDSSSDVDMLERAAYKICVDHPRSTLRDIALERGPGRGWFVVQPESVIEQVSDLLLK